MREFLVLIFSKISQQTSLFIQKADFDGRGVCIVMYIVVYIVMCIVDIISDRNVKNFYNWNWYVFPIK